MNNVEKKLQMETKKETELGAKMGRNQCGERAGNGILLASICICTCKNAKRIETLATNHVGSNAIYIRR